MRRILLVLTVAVVMAAMMLATAVPALADKGGGGHFGVKTNPEGCDQFYDPVCESTITDSGGSGGPDGGGGGHFSNYWIRDRAERVDYAKESYSGGHGGPGGGGGGRCTDEGNLGTEFTRTEHGSDPVCPNEIPQSEIGPNG